MKKMKYIIYLFVALFAATSCEDFLNITPDGQAKRDELLGTQQGIEDAMYGVYSQMRSTTLYGQELHFQTLEVMAHNLYCDGNTSIEALGRFEYDNTNVKSLFESIWTAMYKNISNVNSVLDAPLVADAKEFPFTVYRGEALGLRAFMHFDLVRLFAEQYTVNPEADGIPYSNDFSLETPEFESLAKNYKHILADLHEAEQLLENEDEYEGSGNYMLDRQIHFNKYAVWATLARVYLTMGDNENACKYAKKVIDESGFVLREATKEYDLAGVLSETECIFGIYSKNFYSQVYAKLQQTTTRYSLNLRYDYLDRYGKDKLGHDYREDDNFEMATIGSDKLVRLKKLTEHYELNNIVANRPEHLILGINMIRIPEMYYIVAEVMLEKNPEMAFEYYNKVREHRGLEPLTGTTIDEDTGETVSRPLTLQHINDERFKEYIGEGQLFFNMKRLNLEILSFDGTVVYEPSKDIYVVPIPDIEKENRY